MGGEGEWNKKKQPTTQAICYDTLKTSPSIPYSIVFLVYSLQIGIQTSAKISSTLKKGRISNPAIRCMLYNFTLQLPKGRPRSLFFFGCFIAKKNVEVILELKTLNDYKQNRPLTIILFSVTYPVS